MSTYPCCSHCDHGGDVVTHRAPCSRHHERPGCDHRRDMAAGGWSGLFGIDPDFPSPVDYKARYESLRAKVEALRDDWTCPDDGMCNDLCESKRFADDLARVLATETPDTL